MRAKYVEVTPDVLESLLKTRDFRGMKRIASNLPEDACLYEVSRTKPDGKGSENYLFYFRSQSWPNVEPEDIGPFEIFLDAEYETYPAQEDTSTIFTGVSQSHAWATDWSDPAMDVYDAQDRLASGHSYDPRS